MSERSDILIIGAGIAGTSAGYWLAAGHQVTVLEMEDQPGYHTTGRSLAMYTEAYGPFPVRALAKASHGFLTSPPDGFSPAPLSERSGFMFIAREDQLASLESALAAVRDSSPEIRALPPAEAISRVPVLREDYLAGAFIDPNTLSLDVGAIHQGFIRGLRAGGGAIVGRARVESAERRGGVWRVRTAAGDFEAPLVINAAGAWADEVGRLFGALTIGLQPMRRTVVAFAPPDGVTGEDRWPFVFDTDEDFYFKLDAGAILGSLADETPVPAQDVQPEEVDVATAVDRIQRATTMKVTKLIRRWAGLRNFVPDHVPVVGPDPQAPGYVWCAGQGGYGIETAYALGQCTASLVEGGSLPAGVEKLGVTRAHLDPARLA